MACVTLPLKAPRALRLRQNSSLAVIGIGKLSGEQEKPFFPSRPKHPEDGRNRA
jgi:hypothetical protein